MTTIIERLPVTLLPFALLAAVSLPACPITTDGGETDGDDTAGGDKGTYFHCHNGSNYQVNAAGGQVQFDVMNACPELDENYSWDAPENEKAILDACTKVCKNSIGGAKNHCENSGWSGYELVYGTPEESTCDPALFPHQKHGEDIEWLDGVDPSERLLTCDLDSTCKYAFGPSIAQELLPGATLNHLNEVETIERRGAMAFMVRLENTARGAQAVHLAGSYEFVTTNCAAEACPIYLRTIDIRQSPEIWPLELDMKELGTIRKQISGMRIQLAAPSVGIVLNKSNQIAFPAGTLRFAITADVAGEASMWLADGSQSFSFTNPIGVVARLNRDSLELDLQIPFEFGSLRLKTIR